MAETNRREFGHRLAAGLVGTALAGSREAGAQSSPPNIVFFCSDQHAYKYTGYAGHPLVKTPNLDRIAQRGSTFTSAYCTSPVCVPSRAGMISGMYPSDTQSFCNSTVWDGSHPSWGLRLREAGYYGLATGKLDLNPKFELGFEEVDTGHGHITNPDITSLFRRPVCYRIGEREGVDGKPRDERHHDAQLTDTIEAFLRGKSKALGRPWCAYLGATLPHPAFRGLRRHYDYYYPQHADLPELPPGHLEDLHLMFQEMRHFKRVATPIAEERVRRARAAYYAMVTELDEYVGRIWQALEETGQLDNTIFIYTSDHGESLGDHGLWYKNHLYDVAARVPLVMAGPGIPAGKRIDVPVSHTDLVYTLLEWGGGERPSHLRGHSLRPLLEGKKGDHPGFAYCESHSEGNCTGSFMIRKGDWKYIHFSWYEDLLFNLADDPGEFRNRAGDPEAQAILKELRDILYAQVDPEEVTLRAFRTQETMLQDMAAGLGRDGLVKALRGRLGEGQARLLAEKHS